VDVGEVAEDRLGDAATAEVDVVLRAAEVLKGTEAATSPMCASDEQ